MACGEYLHVHGVEKSVRIFFGWRSMLASPVLQIAKIASAVFFQTQSRVNAQAACKSKAFTFVFPCALYGVLTARHAVVHLTSCSEASSEADHFEVNAIKGQQLRSPQSS